MELIACLVLVQPRLLLPGLINVPTPIPLVKALPHFWKISIFCILPYTVLVIVLLHLFLVHHYYCRVIY